MNNEIFFECLGELIRFDGLEMKSLSLEQMRRGIIEPHERATVRLLGVCLGEQLLDRTATGDK